MWSLRTRNFVYRFERSFGTYVAPTFTASAKTLFHLLLLRRVKRNDIWIKGNPLVLPGMMQLNRIGCSIFVIFLFYQILCNNTGRLREYQRTKQKCISSFKLLEFAASRFRPRSTPVINIRLVGPSFRIDHVDEISRVDCNRENYQSSWSKSKQNRRGCCMYSALYPRMIPRLSRAGFNVLAGSAPERAEKATHQAGRPVSQARQATKQANERALPPQTLGSDTYIDTYVRMYVSMYLDAYICMYAYTYIVYYIP